MAALIESLAPQRRMAAYSFDEWLGLFNPDHLALALQTTQPNVPEQVDATFAGFASGLYLRNSIVFACLLKRAQLFSEARFQFQQLRNGQPGRLFGTPELAVLERPQPGWTTRDLLQMAILDADLAGAHFALGDRDAIYRLRPDFMTIAKGVPGSDLGSWDPRARILGFGYYPGGFHSGEEVRTFLPEQIGFFAPTKNPLTGSGISLLVAALREVMADTASTTHKLQFFEHAATPNLALKFPPNLPKEKALEWIELFEQEHRGALNAWKTIYLGNGVEPVPVGLNFQEMDYKKVQGHAETRIAALTGMHPVVVGFSEGLGGSALNEGNYGAARRNVGDTTLRPLWGDISSSFETIVPARGGTRLWYDERHIAFLRDDVKDQADILQKNMATIASGITQGFEPSAVVDAVVANDLSRLQNAHTGLVSVQLQPPGIEPSTDNPPVAKRVSAGELRQLLNEGWRAATELDDRLVTETLARASVLGPARTGQSVAVRDFTPADNAFRSFAHVPEGATYADDHPLVIEYPSLFSRIEERPGLIVTKAQVTAKRTELLAAGQSAGYDSLARELNTSRDTIRRRLRGE